MEELKTMISHLLDQSPSYNRPKVMLALAAWLRDEAKTITVPLLTFYEAMNDPVVRRTVSDWIETMDLTNVDSLEKTAVHVGIWSRLAPSAATATWNVPGLINIRTLVEIMGWSVEMENGDSGSYDLYVLDGPFRFRMTFAEADTEKDLFEDEEIARFVARKWVNDNEIPRHGMMPRIAPSDAAAWSAAGWVILEHVPSGDLFASCPGELDPQMYHHAWWCEQLTMSKDGAEYHQKIETTRGFPAATDPEMMTRITVRSGRRFL